MPKTRKNTKKGVINSECVSVSQTSVVAPSATGSSINAGNCGAVSPMTSPASGSRHSLGASANMALQNAIYTLWLLKIIYYRMATNNSFYINKISFKNIRS